MGQTQSDRVDKELVNVLTEIERSHLRKLRDDSYRCSAKCCQGPYTTPDVVDKCVKDCSKPVDDSYNYVMSEIASVRSNMDECFLDCESSLLKPTDKYSNLDKKTKNKFDACVVKCVDDNINLLPNMMDKMRRILDSGELYKVKKHKKLSEEQ